MQPGEVEPDFAAQLDVLLRRACQIARALTGAEQAALKVDPKGDGLHGMTIPPGEVIRLTDESDEGTCSDATNAG